MLTSNGRKGENWEKCIDTEESEKKKECTVIILIFVANNKTDNDNACDECNWLQS